MKRITVVLSSLLVAACASSPATDSAQESQVNGQSTSTTANSNAASKTNASGMATGQPATEAQELQKQSVYFDFDDFAIKT